MNAPANIAVPNLTVARAFIAAVTGDPDTQVCVRCIHDRKKHHAIKMRGTIAELWPEILRLQRLGYGAFVVVNEGGHHDKSITRIRAGFVDGDGIPLPETWHMPPDLIVIRDELHWHAYWLIGEGFPVEQFETLQHRLAAHYGTDPKVCNRSRVMRLPGTLHQKTDTPILVTCEDRTAGIRFDYSFDQLAVGLPEVRAVTKTPDDGRDDDFEWDQPQNVECADARLRQLVKNGDVAVDGQQGNQRTYNLACEVIGLGVSPAKTFDLMGRIWNPECVPPWSEDDLAEIVAHAAEYRQSKGAPNAKEPGSKTFAQIAVDVEAESVAEVGSGFPAPTAELMSGTVAISEGEMVPYFASCYRDKLQFDHTSGKWFACRFNGEDSARWIAVPEHVVWNGVRKRHRDVVTHTHTITNKDAKAMMQKSFIAHVTDLAKGHEDIALTSSRWDADPWMLNTPGGIVDLRTGDMRPTEPGDYCTKSTAVAPDFKMKCPIWDKFISDITAGDGELQAFLQRMAGYCLTGDTSEHAMFFLYGTGANGKSVYTKTLEDIAHDYAVAAPMETFTQSTHDRHPTELAMLRGARLVAAQETDQGRKWAEAKIKMLTGGDPVRARFMHQDFFEYVPLFKLMVVGNHKPRLENVDEAIRRRLHLVPFTVTIPEAKRDAELLEKLKDEWPAILAWAIAGCLDWLLAGLCAPPAVKDATREYFEDQDPLADWLVGRCVLDRDAWTASADLYADYSVFTPQAERDTRKRFGERLESHGFRARKMGKGNVRGFCGIALKDLPEDAQEIPT
jgi:P4 family phage/plasmid primase-like protien